MLMNRVAGMPVQAFDYARQIFYWSYISILSYINENPVLRVATEDLWAEWAAPFVGFFSLSFLIQLLLNNSVLYWSKYTYLATNKILTLKYNIIKQ